MILLFVCRHQPLIISRRSFVQHRSFQSPSAVNLGLPEQERKRTYPSLRDQVIIQMSTRQKHTRIQAWYCEIHDEGEILSSAMPWLPSCPPHFEPYTNINTVVLGRYRHIPKPPNSITTPLPVVPYRPAMALRMYPKHHHPLHSTTAYQPLQNNHARSGS